MKNMTTTWDPGLLDQSHYAQEATHEGGGDFLAYILGCAFIVISGPKYQCLTKLLIVSTPWIATVRH